MKKVLFLCTGNSCRSQMAEGLGKKYLNNFEVQSAGTIPEKVNPYAIEAMRSIGIDISTNKSKKIEYSELGKFDFVITLCGDAKDKCPVIDTGTHIHWDIPDPAKVKGSVRQIELEFSKIRDMINLKINSFKNKFK